jgi:hypothetical protein
MTDVSTDRYIPALYRPTSVLARHLPAISQTQELERFAEFESVLVERIEAILERCLGGVDIEAILDRALFGNWPVPRPMERPDIRQTLRDRLTDRYEGLVYAWERDRALTRARTAEARRRHAKPPAPNPVRTPVSGDWMPPTKKEEEVKLVPIS